MIDVGEYVEYNRSRPGEIWNLPIDHWSPSSLDMLRRCPYQWQQRYLKGRKERPGEAPTLGSAVHRGIEFNYTQKVDSHDDLALEDVLGWYAEVGYPEAIAEAQEKAGLEIAWDTDFERARARGQGMLVEYQNRVAPRIQPLAVESEISVDFGLAVPIIGRFDAVRSHAVIDIKTGKKKQTEPKASWRIQAAVYGEAVGKPVEFHSVSAGIKPNGSSGIVTVLTPLEAEGLLVQPSDAEREEMKRSLQTLSAMACLFMAMHGPDEDWPTLGRFHDWACSYCGYRAGCPAWRTS